MSNFQVLLSIAIIGLSFFYLDMIDDEKSRAAIAKAIIDKKEAQEIQLDGPLYLKLVGALADDSISIKEMNKLTFNGDKRFSVINYIFNLKYKREQEDKFVRDIPRMIATK